MKTSALAASLFWALSVWQGCAQTQTSVRPVKPKPGYGKIPVPTNELCKVSVCFAIDESGSVGTLGFQQATTAALNIAASLGIGSTFSAVQYTNVCQTILDPTESYPTAANTIFSNTLEGGGTRSEEGLKCCEELLSDAPGPKLIVLLTDGDDSGDANVQQAAAMLKPGHFIATVNVGSVDFNPSLESLATGASLAVEFKDHDDLIKKDGPLDEAICGEPCCEPASICYAIDESGSISSDEFTAMTNGVVAVTSTHNSFSEGMSMYSAVGFGSVVETVAPLDIASNFYSPVLLNTQGGGGTPMAAALRLCDKILLNAPEPRIVVLLSDGFNNNGGTEVIDVANDISPPVRIVSVGIGSSVDDATLSQVAGPNSFIQVTDFPQMLQTVGNITEAICTSRDRPDMSKVPPFEKYVGCTQLTCAICSNGSLQCFIRSGSSHFDELVMKDIARNGNKAFANAMNTCRLFSKQYKSREYYPSETFGQYLANHRDSAVCRGKGGIPRFFISIKVCRGHRGGKGGDGGDGGLGPITYKCATKRCRARDLSCASKM